MCQIAGWKLTTSFMHSSTSEDNIYNVIKNIDLIFKTNIKDQFKNCVVLQILFILSVWGDQSTKTTATTNTINNYLIINDRFYFLK
jgi:hypothetical protein